MIVQDQRRLSAIKARYPNDPLNKVISLLSRANGNIKTLTKISREKYTKPKG